MRPGGRARAADGRAARGRRDAGRSRPDEDELASSTDGWRWPRSTARARSSSPASWRRSRRWSPLARSRAADVAAEGQPCLPLAADGPDARRLPRRRRAAFTCRDPVVSTHRSRPGRRSPNPEYWVRHVREAVRFADGVAAAEAAGVTRWIELGPDGVLCGMAARSVDEDAVLVPALRADRPEAEAFATLLATAHVAGVTVDWRTLLAGDPAARAADLRLPAPQLLAGPAAHDDQPGTGHPILDRGRAADRRGRVAVHRPLLARTHAWVADHLADDTVVVPARRCRPARCAPADVGCDMVEELTLEAPLLPKPEEVVELQLLVDAADGAAGASSRCTSASTTASGRATPAARSAWPRRPTRCSSASRPGRPRTPRRSTPTGSSAAWPRSRGSSTARPSWAGRRLAARRRDLRRGRARGRRRRRPPRPAPRPAGHGHARWLRADLGRHRARARARASCCSAGRARASTPPAPPRLRIVAIPAGEDTIRVAAVDARHGRPRRCRSTAVGMRSVELDKLAYRRHGRAAPRELDADRGGRGGATDPGDDEVWCGARRRRARRHRPTTLACCRTGWPRSVAGRLVIATRGAVAAAEARCPTRRWPPSGGSCAARSPSTPAGSCSSTATARAGAGGRRSPSATAEPQRRGSRRPACTAPRRPGGAAGRADAAPARAMDPDGTVLITGGTGGLGALLARHLVPSTASATCCSPAAAARTRRAWTSSSPSWRLRVARRRLRPRRARRSARRCWTPCRTCPRWSTPPACSHDATIETLTAERSTRAAPEGRRRAAPVRADGRLDVAFVLFSSAAGTLGAPGPGQLRRGQRVPRRARRSARRRTATVAGVGPVGARERHDRHARHGRHGPPGAARARRDRAGARPAAVRRGRSPTAAPRSSRRPSTPSRCARRPHLAGVPALLRGLGAGARSASATAARCASSSRSCRRPSGTTAVLGVVRGQVAAVLGHGAPRARPRRRRSRSSASTRCSRSSCATG